MTNAPTAAELIDGVTLPIAAASLSSPPPPSADVTDQAAPAGAESQAESPAATPEPATVPAENDHAFAGEKDAIGREFHPGKFRLKDGVPQRDSRGWFVPLGLGGAKREYPATPETEAGSAKAAPSSSLPPDESAAAETELGGATITAELSAEVAINLVQTVLIMIGEEEGILTPLEERMLKAPLTRCLNKYKLSDKMTPELEAAAIIALLFQRRLKKPKTQTWFQTQLAKLRGWWIARRVARAVPETTTV